MWIAKVRGLRRTPAFYQQEGNRKEEKSNPKRSEKKSDLRPGRTNFKVIVHISILLSRAAPSGWWFSLRGLSTIQALVHACWPRPEAGSHWEIRG